MRRALLIAAILVAPLSFAQDSVVLKRTAKVGEVAKFKLVVDTEISGMVIKFTANVKESVAETKDDGGFSIKSEQADAVLNIGGQEQPAPGGVGDSATTIYAANGSVVEIKSDEASTDAYRLANLQAFLYPKEAVAVGGKWEAVVAENKKNETPEVKMNYEVVAKESLGTRTVFKVTFSAVESSGSNPASNKGTVWVDIANGMVVKSESQWHNVPIAGQVIDGKVSMTINE